MEPSDVIVGETYQDTETGWVGIATKPDEPAAKATVTLPDGSTEETVKQHTLTNGRVVSSVGPDPEDPTKWVVLDQGRPMVIGRELLPLAWPLIGLQGPGPKGVDERRYFNAAGLVPITDPTATGADEPPADSTPETEDGDTDG